MRANDLIWSSVVNHYLLDKPSPPSDLLYWFEDGARIPAAFLKSYNRDFLLGGSGHNAGVINPPAANKHGYWTNAAQPEGATEWLDTATRNEGSWWPHWTKWLGTKGKGKQVAARTISDGIEPAPGSYARSL